MSLSRICEIDASILNDVRLGILFPINEQFNVPRREPDAFNSWAQGHPDMYLHRTYRDGKGHVGFSTDISIGMLKKTSPLSPGLCNPSGPL